MLARMAVGNFFIVACVLCATVVEGMRITWLASAIRNNETVLINTIDYHEDISSYNVASPMPALYIAIPMFCFVFAELLCNITGIRAVKPLSYPGTFATHICPHLRIQYKYIQALIATPTACTAYNFA